MPRRACTFVFALALLALPLCAGCGTFLSLLRINPDGSGTIEQTVRLNAAAASFMGSMDEGGKGGSDEVFPEEEIRARAAGMGEGVRFENMERFSGGGEAGYRAVYAFDDVRTVRFSVSPAGTEMSGPDGKGAASLGKTPKGSRNSPAAGPSASAPVTFGFEPGTPATLTMTLDGASAIEGPDFRGDGDGSAQDTSDIQQEMGVMSMVFRDARMRVVVEPQGTLLSTNATHREDGTVTLLDLNFNELMADRQALRRLLLSYGSSLSEAEREALFRELPGFRVETQETVTVQFE